MDDLSMIRIDTPINLTCSECDETWHVPIPPDLGEVVMQAIVHGRTHRIVAPSARPVSPHVSRETVADVSRETCGPGERTTVIRVQRWPDMPCGCRPRPDGAPPVMHDDGCLAFPGGVDFSQLHTCTRFEASWVDVSHPLAPDQRVRGVDRCIECGRARVDRLESPAFFPPTAPDGHPRPVSPSPRADLIDSHGNVTDRDDPQ